MFGVYYVFSCLVRGTLLGWHDSFVGEKRKKAWWAIPLGLFWTIWKERNSRSIENEGHSIQGWKHSFLYNLGLSWFRFQSFVCSRFLLSLYFLEAFLGTYSVLFECFQVLCWSFLFIIFSYFTHQGEKKLQSFFILSLSLSNLFYFIGWPSFFFN